MPGTDTVVTGGTIDAHGRPDRGRGDGMGDVLVIFGATLITWLVTDEWLLVPGSGQLSRIRRRDRFLSAARVTPGHSFVDWVRHLLRGAPKPGPDRERLVPRLG